MVNNLLIYGSEGFARETAWLGQQLNYVIVGFIDDDPNRIGKIVNGISVYSFEEASTRFPKSKITVGIGSPKIRSILVAKCKALDLEFTTLIHPNVEMSKWNQIDEGTLICAGTIITVNVHIHNHVHVNLDCTIGHDVILDEYVTLAPGVHVSGNVVIGKRVYVGTGATILNGQNDIPLKINDDAIIGAGACVTRDVAAGLTVVGVPAKPL